MINALKFVQGAVAKKGFVQALTHFNIENGRITGYNGSLALSSPIDLDLNVKPKATAFVKAIQTCKETVQIHLTPAKRLAIKSGKFKAFVDCIEEAFPEIQPQGEIVELDGKLLQALKLLNPFIGEDDSRRWARGIMFRQGSALVTNNIIIIEHWLGYTFPVEVNIPKPAVVELLRIGEEPVSMQISENNVTFNFEGERWLRTQTYNTNWPDISKVLDREANPKKIPTGFYEALTDLVPFVDELTRVFMIEGKLATSTVEGVGASLDLPDLPEKGIFPIKQLQLLENVASTIDFDLYPTPCLFFGDNLRGAIVGMRG